AEFERNWGKTIAAREAAQVTAGQAIRTAAGAGLGAAWGATSEDPNDPYYSEKVAAKTVGLAGAAFGVPFASGLVKRGGEALGTGLAHYFAPTENLGSSGLAQSAIQKWEGEHRLGGTLGQMFNDRTRAIFGKAMDTDMAAYIERTGQLPSAFASNKAAQ